MSSTESWTGSWSQWIGGAIEQKRGSARMTTFGFIGTGHMGNMLVRKFVETSAIKAEDILASNRTPEKAKRLANATGIRSVSNQLVAELSDIVFLCVRPFDVREVLLELGHLLTPEKLLVSVAADVSLSALHSQCRSRVARALPSMASERLQGMTLLTFGDNTTIADRRLVNGLFDAIGDAVEVKEKDFGVLADLTSSAPGYLAALMSEFVLAAERKAIPAKLAERLVKQTLIGTALLLKEESFKGLIASVATKGGITEAGVSVIQRDAPEMFDQLFTATEARHELVKRRLDRQSMSK
jgi:pyrroline-5-carboxylate reductase